jgi:hypothetical protein
MEAPMGYIDPWQIPTRMTSQEADLAIDAA